ncbi:N-acetylmuramate alpha-1-phosphate uridylyltransferase MurU [Paucibacter sp. M5-1]|uniref:N-acetylmuramate alpha-1-phosphate uridylyltransferase MurU n=1 Tax=Paucibacter sp. M5-1 TaxID=3015998 RepID=UPI0022B94033|nr:nucleotidyltransferase family protein [Paucibacter sp. M5-1]MCZ7881441.1 nucleotidyltransferase family protein [Paucibacter sp. M5-1]
MRAIILAAGRGERMRPLTDTTPKPLLSVRGKPLIVWHIEALAAAGVRDIVINTAWLSEQFPATLGDGSAWGLRLHYSVEAQALETAGGIAQALPLLTADGDAAFWVVSADVFLPEFRFDADQARRFADGARLAHLWMVANSPHHPDGDFAISAEGLAANEGGPRHTWSCIGLYRAEMFAGITPGTRARLRPSLDAGIAAGRIGAEFYAGPWTDVGTVARLDALNRSA